MKRDIPLRVSYWAYHSKSSVPIKQRTTDHQCGAPSLLLMSRLRIKGQDRLSAEYTEPFTTLPSR